MSDDKQTNFEKAQESAALAVAVIPFIKELLAAAGDFIVKVHGAHKKDEPEKP